jgi:hypothetical protein
VTKDDPRRVAARLGIDEAVVERLQARGYLRALALEDAEIRERLYLAHASLFPAARAAGSRSRHPSTRRRTACTPAAEGGLDGASRSHAPGDGA